MFWGRADGMKTLIKVDGKINSDNYIKILNDHALPNINLHEIFQQDNAPAHVSAKTREFMSENAMLELEDWPPQNLDINIIENLWSVLKQGFKTLSYNRGPTCRPCF